VKALVKVKCNRVQLFAFALLNFTGLREKIERADPPRCFRGVAVALVTAGLLSLAFMGFSGLVK